MGIKGYDAFWKQFKSGTDIRGVASEGVQGQEVNLTDEVCSAIASAFLLWLGEKRGKKPSELRVAIGHDSRISAERIRRACVSAFTAAGASVLDSGLSSTPAMFMITLDHDLDGAVQITASHHPFNRNGLKFFTPDGGLEGEDIAALLHLCADSAKPEENNGGKVESIDYMSEYAAHLRKLITDACESGDRPLEGFKIAVDAGNGAGGFYAGEVLARLGADVSGSRYLEPDGMFPNHIPNPENKQAMESIREATLGSKSDLGVIFDTDVDRAGAVDSLGEEINRNRLIALAAAIALDGNEGGTIVTDSTTSLGLEGFINNTLGGVHYRYRRGYRNVINKAIELNKAGVNCPLAIETSGHAALRENYFLDDGAYLVTKIIILLARLRKEGKTLDSLTASLVQPADESEVRLAIKEKEFAAYGEGVLKALEQYAEAKDGWRIAEDNREGLRVFLGDGFFLLRLSVHDPIMPINLESASKGGCKAIARGLLEFLESFDGLDRQPLESYINS